MIKIVCVFTHSMMILSIQNMNLLTIITFLTKELVTLQFSQLIRNNVYPAYPEFTTFISRLKTFNLFPSSQDKYSLAESGFIYSGKKDTVECFCCGLILHYWEKEDNPWIEHSRWNPKCEINLLKM
ncbi:death-associated inhibitor of apoptosis 1-like [Aphis craccivora]|uniref:Death-associated inhibitor of apoptosis 1-like n=1 Tax=Aphis craccivora TaxID=307492 RepID=A0A6G0Z531_APHCR|nr:death-associated inhibitor of apoptosis 1-like [Aphis craccivora]